MKKTAKKKVRKIARDAITGQIVPLWYAKLHPKTLEIFADYLKLTVVETVKR